MKTVGRVRSLALLAITAAFALASRRYAPALPDVIGRYAGDTLWATAVVLGLRGAWPGGRTRSLAVCAALIATGIELSQLAHPAWLDALRRWPGAGLLIGYDFAASDLACYAAGILLGAALDRWALRSSF